MGRALPTEAAVSNVIAAIKKAGLSPTNVQVCADGSFTMAIGVDDQSAREQSLPIQWGKKG